MIPQTQKKGRHRRTSRIFRVGRDGSEIHPAHAATRRAVDHPGRVNAVVPQGGDEVQRLPVAVRHARIKTLLAQAPAAQRCHVGPDAGLIDEDRAPGVKLVLMGLPACALEAFASRVEALAGLENVIKQR